MAQEGIDIVVTKSGADEAAASIDAIGEAGQKAAQGVDVANASIKFMSDAVAQTNSPIQEMNGQLAASEGLLRAQQSAADRAGITLEEYNQRTQNFIAGQTQATNVVQEATAATDKHTTATVTAGHETNALKEATGLLTEALTFLGIAFSVEKVISYAESFEKLQLQLGAVSQSTKEVQETTDKLLALSNATGTSLSSNAQAFQRLSIETRGLNIDQKDLLDVIKNVDTVVRASGGSSTEAAQAVNLFGRALATGEVQGRQLRTVLLQFPALAQTVAAGLNVPLAALTSFSAKAPLASKDFVEAFNKASKSVDEVASHIKLTFGQALTVLQNQITDYIGRMNEASGATSFLSSVVLVIANHFEAIATAVRIAATAFAAWFTVMTVIPGVINLVTAAVRAFNLALAANPISLIVIALTTVIALVYQFGQSIKLNADGSITLLGALVGSFNFLVEKVKDLGHWLSFLTPIWTAMGAVATAVLNLVLALLQPILDVLAYFVPSLQGVVDAFTKASEGIVKAMKEASKATEDTSDHMKTLGSTATSTAGAVKSANDAMKASTAASMKSMQEDIDATAAAYKKLEFTTRDSMGNIVKYLSETDVQSGRLFNDVTKGADKATKSLNSMVQATKDAASAATTGARTIDLNNPLAQHTNPQLEGGVSTDGGTTYHSIQDDIDNFKRYGIPDAPPQLLDSPIPWNQLLSEVQNDETLVAKVKLAAKAHKVPGFMSGGSFTVGGTGAADSQLVQFMATPGEKVTVETPDQMRSPRRGDYNGGASKSVVVNMKVVTPDANSFRRSQNQNYIALKQRLAGV